MLTCPSHYSLLIVLNSKMHVLVGTEREMDEERRQGVMSLELAIQRELAYRKKVASLRAHSNDFFEEDLLPLQVPSSSPGPSLLPGPNLNSSSSINLVPRSTYQVPSTIPRPFPVPTQIPSPRPKPGLDPHPPGINRKATTSGLQCLPPQPPTPSQNIYIIIDQEGNFFCKICRVPCSGASNLKQHLKGHKHKATLQWLHRSKEQGKNKEDQHPHCELCQIWCSHVDAFNMHLEGQKHQAKLKELEPSKNSGQKANKRPRCDLCQIWCMNDDAFKQHLKGKNHVTRLYAIEEKNKSGRG